MKTVTPRWVFLMILCGLGLGGTPHHALWAQAQAASRDYVFHTVRKGETLEFLGKHYHVSWQSLAQLNAIRHPYKLSRGQVLKIPKGQFKIVPALAGDDSKGTTDVAEYTFFPSQTLMAKIRSATRIDAPEMLHWRYIVVHHSATPNGNARGFDDFHKRRRHMSHGLAYHFVIDNGYGGPNGQLEVGKRWKEQWPGGHTANRLMNEIGIGICLVGNFEKSQPSRQQLETLAVLCKTLQDQCGIPERNVILHRHVAQRGTLCPGSRFPWQKLRRMLLGTKLPS